MKRAFGTLFYAALLTVSAVPALCAAADTSYEVEYTNEKPLMVIRFNQPHLRFEKQLYTVVSQALQAKPSVMFDIVSVAPRAQDSSDQDRYNQMTAQNTHRVLATLTDIGLPQSRISLTTAQDNVPASEVRIFVR